MKINPIETWRWPDTSTRTNFNAKPIEDEIFPSLSQDNFELLIEQYNELVMSHNYLLKELKDKGIL